MSEDRDIVRSLAVAGSAAAVIAVPNLGPLIRGRGEQTDRYDTAITPPGYAFAVWAPIFVWMAANAVQAVTRRGRHSSDHRRTDWPLTAAYATNAAWSVAAQSDHFGLTPALLPAAVGWTALASRRLQSAPPGAARRGESVTSVSTGLLLGWTSLAATVNLSAGTQLRGADPTSRASVWGSSAGLLVASATLARVIRTSNRGVLATAGTAVWGLATLAADRRRSPVVRVVAGASALMVAGAALGSGQRMRAD